jgi:hypothetical protein
MRSKCVRFELEVEGRQGVAKATKLTSLARVIGGVLEQWQTLLKCPF